MHKLFDELIGIVDEANLLARDVRFNKVSENVMTKMAEDTKELKEKLQKMRKKIVIIEV